VHNIWFRSRGYETLDDLPQSYFIAINACISLVPLFFALFYPHIGTILAIASSISALFMIYIVPVLTYFKMRKLEIMYPMLAAALQENEVEFVVPNQPRKDLPRNIMDSSAGLLDAGSTGAEPTDQMNGPEFVGQGGALPKDMSKSPKLVISDRFLQR